MFMIDPAPAMKNSSRGCDPGCRVRVRFSGLGLHTGYQDWNIFLIGFAYPKPIDSCTMRFTSRWPGWLGQLLSRSTSGSLLRTGFRPQSMMGFQPSSGLPPWPGGRPMSPCLLNKADFDRVFLIGDSSSGLLVHDVASRAGKIDLSPLNLAGSILIHPGVCRATKSRSELEMPQTPLLTLEMEDKFLSLAFPIGSTKDHPITCPMGPAAPLLSGLHLPPILYCVAEKDLFIDRNMEFYEALKKAGKDVQLFASHNMTHSFYLKKLAVDNGPDTKSQTEKLFEGIGEFIRSIDAHGGGT
ncbi:hypothetical protein Cgig2_001813 [Carnegiea gigantea]|uniref:Alpha/beta hydrolase fold-3 domain-containing protein n=1 Tax=Carnegiea gigantea TaxID=171969 RepID=A0A9Q1GLV4_9CARY|nr:hypothetical protein Cgig2_001813 [Carnegiea gigantea]